MGPGGFGALWSLDPEVRLKVWSGPTSHNGIDSSCFNLSLLSKFQTSKLDQAYYYGCRHTGAWGYKESYSKYKVYYGLKMFGDFIKALPVICDSTSNGTVTILACKSENGRKKGFIVSDYLGDSSEITIEVKGVPQDAEALVWAHDNERNLELIRVPFVNGLLTLKKSSAGSAAFSVWF
jgi:hypothetical protein